MNPGGGTAQTAINTTSTVDDSQQRVILINKSGVNENGRDQWDDRVLVRADGVTQWLKTPSSNPAQQETTLEHSNQTGGIPNMIIERSPSSLTKEEFEEKANKICQIPAPYSFVNKEEAAKFTGKELFDWLKTAIFDDEDYWANQSSQSKMLVAARVCSLLSQARVINPDKEDERNLDRLFELKATYSWSVKTVEVKVPAPASGANSTALDDDWGTGKTSSSNGGGGGSWASKKPDGDDDWGTGGGGGGGSSWASSKPDDGDSDWSSGRSRGRGRGYGGGSFGDRDSGGGRGYGGGGSYGGGGGDRGGRGRGRGRGRGGGPGSREGDWACPDSSCGGNNFAYRTDCFKCHTPKPDDGSGSSSSFSGGRGGGGYRGGRGRGGRGGGYGGSNGGDFSVSGIENDSRWGGGKKGRDGGDDDDWGSGGGPSKRARNDDDWGDSGGNDASSVSTGGTGAASSAPADDDSWD